VADAAAHAAAGSIAALAWRTAVTAFAAAARGQDMAHVLAIAPDIEGDIGPDTGGRIGSADAITAAYGTALDDAGMAEGGGPMG
jgi:hypothetical protein